MNVKVSVRPYRGRVAHTAQLKWIARRIHFGASDADCWLWLGRTIKGGYGKYGEGGLAHRATYSLWVGPIPQGMTLDHLCRNPRCVNPAHLEPVTMRENTMRGNAVTALNARKTHCDHGHEFTPENTRRTAEGYRQCVTCRPGRSGRAA